MGARRRQRPPHSHLHVAAKPQTPPPAIARWNHLADHRPATVEVAAHFKIGRRGVGHQLEVPVDLQSQRGEIVHRLRLECFHVELQH